MPWNPLSGKSGFVTIGGVQFTFGKWTGTISTEKVKAHNFLSGKRKWLGSIVGSTFKLTMNAYDAGNCGITVGNFYAFVFGYTTLITLPCTCLVVSITPTVDVEGGQTIEIEVEASDDNLSPTLV